jgi:CRP-like cAMP-binding protein
MTVPDLHPTFDKLVRRLERRSALGEEDRRALLSLPHNVKKLPAGAHIVRDGDAAEHCSLILSGFAYRYKITGEGGRQIISFHVAAEFVDLQNSMLGIADHSVQMLTDAEIALIPANAIQELAMARPAIARTLWIDTLIDASIFREWVVNVGRRDSRARIAHLLCEFSLRLKVAGLGEATDYELPMTQEQLADCTGLTPVHVNRTLKALEGENLIARRSSRSIVIGNWRKLAEAGDFDSTYLHLREDEPALA